MGPPLRAIKRKPRRPRPDSLGKFRPLLATRDVSDTWDHVVGASATTMKRAACSAGESEARSPHESSHVVPLNSFGWGRA